nr:hypothetical protein [Streptomyces sp. SAJ15]
MTVIAATPAGRAVGVDEHAGGHQVLDELGDLAVDGLRVLASGEGDLICELGCAASHGDGLPDPRGVRIEHHPRPATGVERGRALQAGGVVNMERGGQHAASSAGVCLVSHAWGDALAVVTAIPGCVLGGSGARSAASPG